MTKAKSPEGAPERIWIPGDHNLVKAVQREHGDYYLKRNWPDDIEYVRVTPSDAPVDSVEGALRELREMLPNEWCITIDTAWQAKGEYCEESTQVRIGVRGTNQHFTGNTLAEATQAVRDWKERQQ